jgi:hypothetical protein
LRERLARRFPIKIGVADLQVFVKVMFDDEMAGKK